MKCKVVVRPSKDGYMAVCKEMSICWSRGKTIDDTIETFRKEYGELCKLHFAGGEQIVFEFSVELKHD